MEERAEPAVAAPLVHAAPAFASEYEALVGRGASFEQALASLGDGAVFLFRARPAEPEAAGH